MRGRAATAAMLVIGLWRAGTAHAQATQIEVRHLKIAERGDQLVLSASFTDVLDADLLDQLRSGFATTIVLRAYLYPDGADALPIAYTAATFRVAYDLWEETYEIQIKDPRGQRTITRRTRAQAVRSVTTLRDLPIARLARVPVGTTHFLGIVVEVNPVSEELLAEVRRWLAQGGGSPGVAGDSSFLGSFVSLFVNPKIPEADRVLRFRSQRFYREKR